MCRSLFRLCVHPLSQISGNLQDSESEQLGWKDSGFFPQPHKVGGLVSVRCQHSSSGLSRVSVLKLSEFLCFSVSHFRCAVPLNLWFSCRRNLRDNTISGNIPSEIGTLRNLRYLDLANNILEGSIPESFSNLTGLYYL